MAYEIGTHRWLRLFARTVFAALVALMLRSLMHSPEKYWIVLAAVLLTQVRIGELFWQRMGWIACFGFLAASVASIAVWLSGNLFDLALFLFGVTAVSLFLGLMMPEMLLGAAIVNLFAMVSAGVPVVPGQNEMRFLDIFLGAIAAMSAYGVLWPQTLKKAIDVSVRMYLRALSHLQETLFSVYLKRDYVKNHYLYEKEIYESHQKIFFAIDHCRKLFQRGTGRNTILYYTLSKRLEHLHEMIITLGHLRYRVQDEAILEMAQNELRDISQALSDIFVRMSFSGKTRHEVLLKRVHDLENLYHSTLSVMTADAIVFLFFIKNLLVLQEELGLLCSDLSKLKNKK